MIKPYSGNQPGEKGGRPKIKDAELRLVSELMKNSRRSDRQLARAIKVSQPTVSRMIRKLEKEGVIKEYTMIPDFQKLGYSMLGLTFLKLRKTLSPEEIEEARKIAKQSIEESTFGIAMLERGIGLGYDGVVVALYRDYTEYVEHKKELSRHSFSEPAGTESFVISLDDNIHYRPLTLSVLAEYVQRRKHSK